MNGTESTERLVWKSGLQPLIGIKIARWVVEFKIIGHYLTFCNDTAWEIDFIG